MGSDNLTKAQEARRLTETMRDLLLLIRARFEEEIREQGVTLAQFRLLKAVEGHSDGSAASIARECGVTPQTLHAMLARASREGWIVRGSTARNQRYVTAALTRVGRGVLEEGRALQTRLEAEIWRSVPMARMRESRKTLVEGVENLRASAAIAERSERHPKR